MRILEDYNDVHKCLNSIDIEISISINDSGDMTIQHKSIEFDTDGHIHCGDMVSGMKMLIQEYLEQLIWKFEDELESKKE